MGDHRHGHGAHGQSTDEQGTHEQGTHECPAHGHAHADVDWAEMSASLERRAEAYAPLTAQIIEQVRAVQPQPRRIVDAGSGPGVVTCALAAAFPQAEVVAVDGTQALLDLTARRAERVGLGDRVRTRLADLPDGLADLGGADVIWLGLALHHLGDQRAALAEFARHLAPGGALVLLEGGLPARYLPRDIGIGRPGLQARLDAAQETWFNEMRAALPDAKDEVEDWGALLTAAGLAHVETRTHLLDLPAPASGTVRAHVADVLGRRAGGLREGLDADDAATVGRLLDPDDEAGLDRRPDVFLLATQTVHLGKRAA
ncbi:class I SAM-dependent methyltransferase [Streptomyces sp. B-S-A8]|uniref:Class I SAM-dependent methyltransferase n=1 Tax=Streptomyces solicavernae TaxID=3043614 RepID=A0ABT6RLN7_9ACTN|nr:class I SAM-dependent methyltransferase [Streptomyces sp. B-S-A8]MDI3385339.1 class I SAM-dependent methyltransferase [Streptomyces sp. B-S-A8]